ncbi:SKP1/ASK-interacting protein 5 [Arabidopsis thaliana]|uniref:SKP1/ASK-interacting protein 5 n=1 Tax=Arabidopsis thaliana TaxID=3702 RepID=A0A1I9LNL7_ARATH|nr:SKP1/ASK-interacting protein 5 [Arabidopsis thaliana]ANM64175.1 SKP1/ASK-interacting protein 5 [Arabidopsis thaliana]|eukprot:NP_001326221.1 SKP1/ASK-interacting protein 5 [Arabidopsis thaliana]
MELHEISKLDNKKHPERIVESKMKKRMKPYSLTSLNNLDDGCLMHILSFLSPIPDRYNTALVCHRWRYLACHPRLWLRVDRFVKDLSQPGVFLNIESAVSAARSVEARFLMKPPSSVLVVQTVPWNCYQPASLRI